MKIYVNNKNLKIMILTLKEIQELKDFSSICKKEKIDYIFLEKIATEPIEIIQYNLKKNINIIKKEGLKKNSYYSFLFHRNLELGIYGIPKDILTTYKEHIYNQSSKKHPLEFLKVEFSISKGEKYYECIYSILVKEGYIIYPKNIKKEDIKKISTIKNQEEFSVL